MLTVTVTPGYTFSPTIPWTTDDLNSAATPTITLSGTIGGQELSDQSIQPRHVQPGPYFTITSTGTANAQILLLNPEASSLQVGLWCSFVAGFTNTGPMTLQVNALTAKAVKKNKDQALGAGDIRAGGIYWVEYDGTAWQLVSPPANAPERYAEDIGTANAYKVVVPGMEVSGYADLVGIPITFLAGNASSGNSTLEVNSMGPKKIVTRVGDNLSTGDILQAQLVTVRYDGQDFQLMNPSNISLPAVGPGAGSYAYPASITLDAKGRVSGLTPGSAPTTSQKAWGTIDPSVGTATKSVSNSSAAGDTLTVTAHGWSNSQLVWLDTGTIGGVSTKVAYYVKVSDANTIQLSTSSTLTPIVDILADAATGTLRYWSGSPIIASSGILAVLWLATGDYWIQFNPALADSHYGVTLGVVSSGTYPWLVDSPTVTSRTAAGFELQAWDRKDSQLRELSRLDFAVTA